jgi:activator of 2-hydroxyglutaryl-CoA dehydratase
MAGRLGMSVEEMGRLEEPCGIKINEGCVVFAELDALSHLKHGAAPKEIAMALVDAMAVRAYSVIVDVYRPRTENMFLCGGMAKNAAFVRALRKLSGLGCVIPEDAEYAGAIGAAAFATA